MATQIKSESDALHEIIRILSDHRSGAIPGDQIVNIAREGIAAGPGSPRLSKEWPESNTIARANYDPATRRLYLYFKTGGRYEYAEVPETCWNDMIAAKSVGQFFFTSISKQYDFIKF